MSKPLLCKAEIVAEVLNSEVSQKILEKSARIKQANALFDTIFDH